VIKAAYRALAQRYHPDKWDGDKVTAQQRMAEINAAYAVLSDAEKRRQYDAELRNSGRGNEYEGDKSEEDDFSDYFKEKEEDWNFAVQFFPSIKEEFEQLGLLNTEISIEFKIFLLETKRFKDSKFLFERMRSIFIDRYFGRDPIIRMITEVFFSEKNLEGLRYLNKSVRVLGDSLDPYAVAKSMPANWGWRSVLVGCLINGRVLRRSKNKLYNPCPPTWEKTDLVHFCENCGSIDKLAIYDAEFKANRVQLVCTKCGNFD